MKRARDSRWVIWGLVSGWWFGGGGASLADVPVFDGKEGGASVEELEQAPILLLVRAEGDEMLLAELRSELQNSRYRLIELRLDARVQEGHSLASLGREQKASAAVRCRARRGTIELWIQRNESEIEDLLYREGGVVEPRIEALRITEALRAHGLDLDPLPTVMHAVPEALVAAAMSATSSVVIVPKAGAVTVAATPPHHSWWGGMGLGALVGPADREPSWSVLARLDTEWQSRFGVQVTGSYQLVPVRVDGAEGSAEVRIHTLMVGTFHRVFSTRAFAVLGGVSAAGHLVTVRGSANPGYRGTEQSHFLGSGWIESRVRLQLGSSTRLGFGQGVGVTSSRLQIKLGDAVRAEWASPVFSLALAVETSLN